jgi:hypothetical protein
MARCLFPCLYPLESAKYAEDATANESMTSENSFPFCIPTTSCCCHLTLNPKQQYLTGNGQSGYLNLIKCPTDFPVALAVELVCQACNASDGCLIRYLELRMQKQSSLVVLGEVVNLNRFSN